MASRRAKGTTGAQLVEFFATNDPELTELIMGLSGSDAKALIAILDEALAIGDLEAFEDQLSWVWLQFQEADDGSKTEAQMAAAVRMLGYEYERAFDGDIEELTATFASVYESLNSEPGAAPRAAPAARDEQRAPASDPSDPSDVDEPDDVFTAAAARLSQQCIDSAAVADQDKALAPTCLYAAAAAAQVLADAGELGGSRTEDYVATMLADDDEEGASHVVSALAWYFALEFLGTATHTTDRNGWLAAMQKALGLDLSLAIEPEQIAELFDSYDVWATSRESFPITFCRWVNVHLGDAWSDPPDIGSAQAIMTSCQQLRDEFRSAVAETGLKSP
ncbi:MAG: hypothetical protein ABIV94_02910 [Acidimicrobiales bacterium]